MANARGLRAEVGHCPRRIGNRMTTAKMTKPEASQAVPAVGIPFHRPVGRPAPKRANLSANQMRVLGLACTHGHLAQGCRTQSDYGALTRTIYSLRQRGLPDVMDQPTDAGRQTYERSKTPNE